MYCYELVLTYSYRSLQYIALIPKISSWRAAPSSGLFHILEPGHGLSSASTHLDNQRGGATGKEHQPQRQWNAQLEGGNSSPTILCMFWDFILIMCITCPDGFNDSFGNHDTSLNSKGMRCGRWRWRNQIRFQNQIAKLLVFYSALKYLRILLMYCHEVVLTHSYRSFQKIDPRNYMLTSSAL